MALLPKKVGSIVVPKDENLISSHFQTIFIVEFDPLIKQEISVYSPKLNGDPKFGDEWRVKFNNFDGEASSARFKLQLVNSESKVEIDAQYQLCILNVQSRISWTGPTEHEKFLRGRKTQVYYEITIAIVEKAAGDKLPMRFWLQVSTVRREIKLDSGKTIFVDENLKSCLINGDFTDVILKNKTSGREFPAVKVILAAASIVFYDLFKSSGNASKSNAVVKIEGFSDETIKGFLQFICTGETESLKENVVELLKMSDRYRVSRLKGQCGKILLKNLTVENSMDILVLAHLHSPQTLTPIIMLFIHKNFNEIKGKDSFGRVKKEHPLLVAELYENVMKMQ